MFLYSCRCDLIGMHEALFENMRSLECGHINAWFWLHLSLNWPFWRLFFVLVSAGKQKKFSMVCDLNFLQSPLILSPPPHLKAFKVVYLNHIFSLFFWVTRHAVLAALLCILCTGVCKSMTACAAHPNLYSNVCAAGRCSLRVKYVQGIFQHNRVPTLPC